MTYTVSGSTAVSPRTCTTGIVVHWLEYRPRGWDELARVNHNEVGDAPGLGARDLNNLCSASTPPTEAPTPYNWKWYRRAAGSALPRQLSIRETALSELGFGRLNDIRFEFFIISVCHRSRAERYFI